MKKYLIGFFVLGFIFINTNTADASILSNLMQQIRDLRTEVSLLKHSQGASALSATADTIPRVMFWTGKVNQHIDDNGVWQTDPDGRSGAWSYQILSNDFRVNYCQKWYPNTINSVEYKSETIDTWRSAGNTGANTSTKMSYKCVEGTNEQEEQNQLATITTPTASNITSNSATFKANLTSLGNPSAYNFGVRYWKTSGEGGTLSLTTQNVTTGIKSINIEDLSPNTSYTFYAFTNISLTNEVHSSYKTFTTLAEEVEQSSQEDSLSGTLTSSGCEIEIGDSDCSAEISWDVENAVSGSQVKIQRFGGLIFSFYLHNGTKEFVIPHGNSTFSLINDGTSLLGPNGKTVTATCVSGSTWDTNDTPTGECKKNNTTITVPNISSVHSVTNITSTTATISGYVSSNGGANITAKGILWSTSFNPTLVDSKIITGTGIGAILANVTGLTPNTTYYVRLFATNSVDTTYSNNISFITSAEENTKYCLANPLTRTIQYGSQGNDVKSLQEILVQEGFFNQSYVDGIFTYKTNIALKSFQTANGLTSDGIAGPITRGALNAKCANTNTGGLNTSDGEESQCSATVLTGRLEVGSIGDQVESLQMILNGEGLLDDYGIDGKFGKGTRAAVIAFQYQNGLDHDGIVGTQTRVVLNAKWYARCSINN